MTKRQRYIARFGTAYLYLYDLTYSRYRELCRAARIAREVRP